MIRIIALREFRAWLTSPLAWTLLAAGQFLLAWRFLQLVDAYQLKLQPLVVRLGAGYGATELVAMRFLGDPWLLILLLLLAAVLAMRLIAEERAQGTLSLLLSSPVSARQIVFGKYLGAWLFMLLMLVLWGLMPLSLALATTVDLGWLGAAWLGLLLLGSALLALATFASSLTAQPGLAAGLAFLFGLLLLVLDQSVAAGGQDAGAFAYLALLGHYNSFLRGTIVSTDIAYFLLLTAGALVFAVRRLDTLRVQA